MQNRLFYNDIFFCVLLFAAIALSSSCRSTRHVGQEQYLLRKNSLTLRSQHQMANKGERKDNLVRLIVQKPNKYAFGLLPFKLGLYNRRYKKLAQRADSSLPKSVERPVILDTAAIVRSKLNMKNYLFNQGYFYAAIGDTIRYRRKKAYVTYNIDAGINYRINRINFDVSDSNIKKIAILNALQSGLQKEKQFTYSLLEEERSRLTSVIRNNGYYRFTQGNVTFQIDTLDKEAFRNIESSFERAINFISAPAVPKPKTIDIDVVIRLADDTSGFKKYTIGTVNVFPDYASRTDLTDSTMTSEVINGVRFNFHSKYVHTRVLYQHTYINPGNIYSEFDYDKTYAKLNELGIFQYLKIELRENRSNRKTLDANILLNRAKKLDFSTNYSISSGTTYSLGNSIGANFRNRNFLKGANLLTIGVNGGLEFSYNENSGNNFVDHFAMLTRYYGLNASIDFPKFLAPIASSLFDKSNLPHTIISVGENVIDRINYFKLGNTSANFAYSWHQTQTITWGLSPVFVNIIRVPVRTDSFRRVLENNEYLSNSYSENFIEGENLTFRYDNNTVKRGINYSYVKLSLEEAGAVLGGVNQLGALLNNLYTLQYARYVKFDFDARHFVTLPRSVVAMRFYGGVGLPYGQSLTLPYIKQYFAGGPYSLRGWRIRTLGPGRYVTPTNPNDTLTTKLGARTIDRTGDIKLEVNGEYRFPITPLFAGMVKMNGAIFADAGNIWLARPEKKFPGAEIALNTFGPSIAADIGIGARFDIASFITLRIDVAIPVKNPAVQANGGWVVNKIDFYNATWRANNIVPQISIGYPF